MAEVSVPAIFSNNMMLQRGGAIPVWGKADAGQVVQVQLVSAADQAKVATVVKGQATAGEDGKWMVRLDLSKVPNETYQLRISGKNEIQIDNVLVGQVWLASGQSNMEWNVGQSSNARQEIAQANYPQIREFGVRHTTASSPMELQEGQWRVASPRTVAGFSAVGYFFAREVSLRLNEPVGIIHSSWGGTDAEAWVSAEGLRPLKIYDNALKAVALAHSDQFAEVMQRYEKELKQWRDKFPPEVTGTQAEQAFSQPDFDDSKWREAEMPQFVQQVGFNMNGVFWLRHQFELKGQALDQKARLHLGTVDDYDVTYVNGVRVGQTPPGTASAYAQQRDYAIPAGVLHEGVNTIAVRCLDTGGAGGFGGPADHMFLQLGTAEISLAKRWRVYFEPSVTVDSVSKYMVTQPVRPGINQNSAGVLFNAMIHPYIPYGIAGALWYQGENNVGRAAQYAKLLSALINDWRTQWDQPVSEGSSGAVNPPNVRDFPFYIVQLPDFMGYQDEPGATGGFANIRVAQQQVANSVAHTDVAVTIGLGDETNIHPHNKQDVGKRLALLALGETYGQNVEYSGPRLEGARLEDSKILLTFSHTTGGLVAAPINANRSQSKEYKALIAQPSPVKGFVIQDGQGKWHFAQAQIVDEHTVEVSAEGVEQPAGIRYAAADSPVANLFNGEGLPAAPFEMTFLRGRTIEVGDVTRE